MVKKFALLWTIVVCLGASFVFAQSSHDAVSGADPDMPADSDSDFGMSSANGKFRLRIRGHVQENNQVNYNTQQKKWGTDIEIKRARLSVMGTAFDPRLTYLFQTGFESEPPTRNADLLYAPGSHFLRDYYFNLASHENYFHIRVGKFRTPFSRQQLMSTSQMQFYDQHNANDEFQLTTTGRDVGIMLHNGFANPFEWALAGVSNGVVGRIGYNHNNIDGYEMTDFKGGDFRFAIAANGFLHTQYDSTKLDDIRGGADFVAKVEGFSTNGAFYYQWYKRDEKAKAMHNLGGGLDLGYLIDKSIEPVARYSWVKKTGTKSPHEHEMLIGVNYYIYGHHLKVQSYAGANMLNSEFQKWLGGVQLQFAI